MLTFMLAGGFYLDSRNIPDALTFIPTLSFVTYTYPVSECGLLIECTVLSTPIWRVGSWAVGPLQSIVHEPPRTVQALMLITFKEAPLTHSHIHALCRR
jgi:hypothetical protein